MPHKADPTVICQCGAIISKYHMPKHIQTAKHTRDMAYVCIHTYTHTNIHIDTYIVVSARVYSLNQVPT
jgi:hypothetical protein